MGRSVPIGPSASLLFLLLTRSVASVRNDDVRYTTPSNNLMDISHTSRAITFKESVASDRISHTSLVADVTDSAVSDHFGHTSPARDVSERSTKRHISHTMPARGVTTKVDGANYDHVNQRTLATDVNDSFVSLLHPTSTDIMTDHGLTGGGDSPVVSDVTENPTFRTALHYNDDDILRCLQEDGHLIVFSEQLTVDVTSSVVSNISRAATPMTCTVTITARPEMGFKVSLHGRLGHNCSQQNYVNVSDAQRFMTWIPNCLTPSEYFSTKSRAVKIVVKILDFLKVAPFCIQAFSSVARLQVIHTSTMSGKQ